MQIDLWPTVFAVLLAILGAMDWYSTRTILNRGGVEQNPIAKQLMEIVGMDAYLFLKLLGVAWIGYMLGEQNPPVLAIGVVAWYGYWMRHNWKSMPSSKE